ncbi:MAG: PilT/PilU family type 4a pilus ATPase [Planctomycetota bacterium]|nr:MAG: PilT/PilU family type 4a pilus ATPase [Planctomycetota bacterium]
MEFQEMLRRMVVERASDLFIKVGSPPSLRIDGKVHFLDSDDISPQDTVEFYEAIEDSKREGFKNQQEIDCAYELPGIGRFRVNIFRQRGYIGFVFRHIESQIPNFKELNLPEEPMAKLASYPRGLVLVTGVTGSGKSTTLAAIINHINMNFNRHIVTIEDPIEFVYKDKKSIINQREIGIDTSDFHTALKHVVRQSPDVILIGEMRDRETMEAAISAAETGHLVFSTLHTVNAQQTVERIINFFPPHQHNLIRLQLSLILEGVISQRLIKRKATQGRLPAVELMIKSPTIKDLLMEGRTTELYKAVREGEYFGSQTFNQALKKMYQSEQITLEEALSGADNPEELKLELKGVTKGTTADFDFEY